MTCSQNYRDLILSPIIQQWTIHNHNCLLIVQDEVDDTTESGLLMPSTHVRKEQSAVGEATVLKLSMDIDIANPLYTKIAVGDRVKFAPGTQINANFAGLARVQLLHIDNVMMHMPADQGSMTITKGDIIKEDDV